LAFTMRRTLSATPVPAFSRSQLTKVSRVKVSGRLVSEPEVAEGVASASTAVGVALASGTVDEGAAELAGAAEEAGATEVGAAVAEGAAEAEAEALGVDEATGEEPEPPPMEKSTQAS
jgi:hypothetical protein